MCRLASKCNINDMMSELVEVKSKKLDLVSDELRSLRGMIINYTSYSI